MELYLLQSIKKKIKERRECVKHDGWVRSMEDLGGSGRSWEVLRQAGRISQEVGGVGSSEYEDNQ